jgi:hypothetical protein
MFVYDRYNRANDVKFSIDVRNTYTHFSLNFWIYMQCLKNTVMHQSHELTQFFAVLRYYVTKVTVWRFVFTKLQLHGFFFCFLIWDRFPLEVIYNSCFSINKSHDNNCSARIFWTTLVELMTFWLVGSHLSCALRSVLKWEPIQLTKSMNYFEIKNTYSTFWFFFYVLKCIL